MKRSASLCDALLPERAGVVAFVGAGGKTTAIVRLAEELTRLGVRTVATTTTRVGHSMSRAMPLVEAAGGNVAERLDRALARGGRAFLTGGEGPDGKLVGVAGDVLEELASRMPGHVFLLEADGSRQRSIKAPAAHEPVIPAATNVVVPVVGLNALGKPLDDRVAHRPELVADLMGGTVVTPELIAALVLSNKGGLKNAPARASVRPLLNRVRTTGKDVAGSIARAILWGSHGRVERVVVSDLLAREYYVLEAGPNGPA